MTTKEDIDDILNCHICHRRYTEPKQLNCGHTYCLECITGVVKAKLHSSNIIVCPDCRQETPLPAKGTEGLKVDFYVNKVSKVIDGLRAKHSDEIPWCCFQHNQVLQLYCDTCERLVCTECITSDQHCRNHAYKTVDQAYDRDESELNSMMKQLDECLADINLISEQLDESCHQVKNQKEAIENNLAKTVEQIHEVLTSRQLELFEQLNTEEKRKLKNLDTEKEVVETIKVRLESASYVLKESLKKKDRNGVVFMKPILKKLLEEMETKFQVGVYQPSVKADLLFSTSAKLIDVINSYGSIHTGSQDLNKTDKHTRNGKHTIFRQPNTIPFSAPVKLFTCDERGKSQSIEGAGVTIPPGAIPPNTTVHIELGVALYGPFTFPENYQPVSPIVWLCIQENIELLSPIFIKLPHMITDIEKVKLSFAKANHHLPSSEENGNYYLEHLNDGESQFENPSQGRCGYGFLQIKHCCLFCIQAETSADTARNTGYCLHTLIKTINPSSFQAVHVCTFFLEGCFQAVKENYPEQEFRRHNREMFKFEANMQLFMTANSQDKVKIVPKRNPSVIRAKEVEFWDRSKKDMKLLHDEKLYPPSLSHTVICHEQLQCATVTFDVNLLGAKTFSVNVHEDFNMPCQVTPAMVQACKEKRVQSEDINLLWEHLFMYTYMWQEIGQALNFRLEELHNIKLGLLENQKLLLLEVLNKWAQWPNEIHPELPTLEKLQHALRSGQVGLGAVAERIGEVYLASTSASVQPLHLVSQASIQSPAPPSIDSHTPSQQPNESTSLTSLSHTLYDPNQQTSYLHSPSPHTPSPSPNQQSPFFSLQQPPSPSQTQSPATSPNQQAFFSLQQPPHRALSLSASPNQQVSYPTPSQQQSSIPSPSPTSNYYSLHHQNPPQTSLPSHSSSSWCTIQ